MVFFGFRSEVEWTNVSLGRQQVNSSLPAFHVQDSPLPSLRCSRWTARTRMHMHSHARTCTHILFLYHSLKHALTLTQLTCTYTHTTVVALSQTHTQCPRTHTHIHTTPHTLPLNTSRAFSVTELQTFNFSFFPFAVGSVTDAIFLALTLSLSRSLTFSNFLSAQTISHSLPFLSPPLTPFSWIYPHFSSFWKIINFLLL